MRRGTRWRYTIYSIEWLDVRNEKHAEEMRSIILSRDTLMRVKHKLREEETNRLIQSIADEDGLVPAFYEDGLLVSFMIVFPWKPLPFYSLYSFYVRNKHLKFFDSLKSGCAQLFSAVIKRMEEEHRYTFFFARACDSKWLIKMQNEGKEEEVCPEFLPRYDYFIEERVPPYQTSEYTAHQNLLGKKVWSVEAVVVRCSLAQRFRDELLKKQ